MAKRDTRQRAPSKKRRTQRNLIVHARSQRAMRGVVQLGMTTIACALGRSGQRAFKREGDGATPMGRLRVLGGFVRRDKRHGVPTALPLRTIARGDGWCDAPQNRNYNRFIRHPYPASAEHLWRHDRLYDLVLVLNANIRPRRRGCGSAIFVHVARAGFKPTEGCIALAWRDLVRVAAQLRRGDSFVVGVAHQRKRPARR